MNLPTAITNLRKLQVERNEDLVAHFEDELAYIAELNDPDCIVLLCSFFDDEEEFDELMFSIIHTIEIFDDTTYVSEIIKAAPLLCAKSPRWASIIFMRILNSRDSTESLVEALRNGTDEQRESIHMLMQKINDVSNEFILKTKPVIEFLS